MHLKMEKSEFEKACKGPLPIFGVKLDRHFWVAFNRRVGETFFLLSLFGLGYFALVAFS